MKDASDPSGTGFADHRTRIVFGVSRVNDDRTIELLRERELRCERTTLLLARRVIVVRVQAALADGDGPPRYEFSNVVRIPTSVERGRVMRMNAGGKKDESRVARRDTGGAVRGVDRLADADDGTRTGLAGALNRGVSIVVERRIGEMRVAVDEGGHLNRDV